MGPAGLLRRLRQSEFTAVPGAGSPARSRRNIVNDPDCLITLEAAVRKYGHNYLTRLKRLIAEGKVPAAPGLWHLEVQHDSWCGSNCGLRCNCDPDIYLYSEEDHSAK